MSVGAHVAGARRYVARVLQQAVQILTSPPVTIACAPLVRGVGGGGRTPRSSGNDRTNHILVVRPDGVGDVVLMGPFLRELKRACPDARITLVVAPRALNLVQTCPYVDRVLTVRIPPPRTVTDSWWRPLARRAAALSLAERELSRREYDLAFVPR